MPPTYSGSASRTVTLMPCFVSRYAAVRPAGPAPMIPTCILSFRRKVAAAASDAQRALLGFDFDGPPGAIAFGIRRCVADDIAPPQVFDDALVLLDELGGVLRKVRAPAGNLSQALEHPRIDARSQANRIDRRVHFLQ